MGQPSIGSLAVPRLKPWRGYPSVNAVHGIRTHIQQDLTKFVSNGLVPSPAGLAGHIRLPVGTEPGAGQPVHIGTVPPGAIILPLSVHVVVGMLPMTTALLDIGTKDTAGTFTAGLLSGHNVAALGFTPAIISGALIGYTANQLELFARLTITGAAPTVGEVDALVPFYIQKD
jgi:hypothetical protein